MANLHQGVAFSPQTTLSENIGAADTIIKVSDSSVFPDPPNYATIGTDELGETIEYAAKAEGLLSGCTRGVEGTAKAWQKGDVIARNFTAKDHNDMIAAVTTAQQTANTAAEAAESAQSSANNAKSAADNAQSTANAAKATAEAALPKSGGTITGEITKIADGYNNILNAGGNKIYFIQNSPNIVSMGCSPDSYAIDPQKLVRIAGINTPSSFDDVANKLYVDNNIVRPNLLDNSYFINPINQRGQTVYQGGLNIMQYTIDRWRSENATVTVENDGLKIYGEATYGMIRQFFENASLLSGKTLTVSVLYPGGTVPAGSYIACIDSTEEFWQVRTNDANLQYLTFTVNDNITTFSTVLVTSNEAHKTIKPIAVKLEIGNTQTLAHEENGVWVLNEIPDYATELLKCQRYYVKSNQFVYSEMRYNVQRASYAFPVQMRTAPTILNVTAVDGVTGNPADTTILENITPYGFMCGVNHDASLTYIATGYEASADL